MDTPIIGDVEILTDHGETSTGILIEARSIEAIPDGLGAIRSLTGFVSIDPPRRGVTREWTARTAAGDEAIVLLRIHPGDGPRHP